jgi:uncharacterized protein (UPF0248 family)
MVYETLNKLKWTGKLNKSKVVILHRGAPGDKKIISGKDITEVHKHYFLYKTAADSEETLIPMHRVLEIEFDGKTIWKKSK